MSSFASKISGAAMLALAALPIAALTTAAHAETAVKVADLNVLSPEGVAAFSQRADAAGRKYCIDQRHAASYAACRAGVKTELTEKFAMLRSAKLAQSSTSFAAR
jgi:UrcA family protein